MKNLIVLCLVAVSSVAMAKISTEAGLSVIRTGGNTQVETYNLKSKTAKEWEKRTLTVGGHYTLATQIEQQETATGSGVFKEQKNESARDWDGYTRYDEILNTKLNVFAQAQYEGNEFAGFKQRNNYDLGAKYILSKTDTTKFFVEAAVRLTEEKAVERNEDDEDVFNDTKGVIFTEYRKKVSKTLNWKFWVQYVPNFTRSEDYQINFEPSFNVTLTDMFSLSMAYTGRYDNELNAGVEKRLDWTHTTSLIANF
jgi:putative salt-induced outer membrane protein